MAALIVLLCQYLGPHSFGQTQLALIFPSCEKALISARATAFLYLGVGIEGAI